MLPLTNELVHFSLRDQFHLLQGMQTRREAEVTKKQLKMKKRKVSHIFLRSEHNPVCKAALTLATVWLNRQLCTTRPLGLGKHFGRDTRLSKQ